MELDLTGTPVVVFRHAGHGRVNLVYRRADGHIGWIDPPAVDGQGRPLTARAGSLWSAAFDDAGPLSSPDSTGNSSMPLTDLVAPTRSFRR